MLSACQTAAGDERAALGLAGVAVQAGARSAVASLWFISDAATAALVEAFYEGVFQRGLGKAEALRQAQLSLLRQKAFAAPSYWAPYLLVGANQ
jgi:CHAT domain-containing protein